MDYSVRVSYRFILILASFLFMSFYIHKTISKPEFKGYFINKVAHSVLGNSSNHTFIKMLDENSKLLSAGISSSFIAIISGLPVIKLKHKNGFLNIKFFFIKENNKRTKNSGVWSSIGISGWIF